MCYAEEWRDTALEDQRLQAVCHINEINFKIINDLKEEERDEAVRRVVTTKGVRCWHDRDAMDCADCPSRERHVR